LAFPWASPQCVKTLVECGQRGVVCERDDDVTVGPVKYPKAGSAELVGIDSCAEFKHEHQPWVDSKNRRASEVLNGDRAAAFLDLASVCSEVVMASTT
jgi:hypothetical protein